MACYNREGRHTNNCTGRGEYVLGGGGAGSSSDPVSDPVVSRGELLMLLRDEVTNYCREFGIQWDHRVEPKCEFCMEPVGPPGSSNRLRLPCHHYVHYNCFMSSSDFRPPCPSCGQEPFELTWRDSGAPACLCYETTMPLTTEPCRYGWVFNGWVCPRLWRLGVSRVELARLWRLGAGERSTSSSAIGRPPRAD